MGVVEYLYVLILIWVVFQILSGNANALPLFYTMNKLTSTLTDRYQTTIPREVRSFLNLDKGAQIQYVIDPAGKVYLQTQQNNELQEDPVLYSFLELMEKDMIKNPKKIQPLNKEFMKKAQRLVKDVDVNLDSSL